MGWGCWWLRATAVVYGCPDDGLAAPAVEPFAEQRVVQEFTTDLARACGVARAALEAATGVLAAVAFAFGWRAAKTVEADCAREHALIGVAHRGLFRPRVVFVGGVVGDFVIVENAGVLVDGVGLDCCDDRLFPVQHCLSL